MATRKTPIIESIFRDRFNSATRELSRADVSLEDVSDAITAFNRAHPGQEMSTRNPANFFKDFIRNRSTANINWPRPVLEAGFTGRQVTGGNACFEFVPLSANQVEPFPPASFAQPNEHTPRHVIQSISLPLASRRLGRDDEPWLIQVITRLKLVESHFSLVSRRSVRQIDLLQMSVKLAGTEIDALFLAHEETEDGSHEEVIITCEAKRGRDDILEDQILRQAKAPFEMEQITQNRVIPIAVKCAGRSQIFVVEFEELERATYRTVESLTMACDSLFEIRPPVPGVCS
jgi:hypothetical protein